MKRALFCILFIFSAVLSFAQSEIKMIKAEAKIPNADRYCGTWEYENQDTLFVVTIKKITLHVIVEDVFGDGKNFVSNKDVLVGGYRFKVKDKFDDNYLMVKDRIPEELEISDLRLFGPRNHVLVRTVDVPNNPGIQMAIYNQNKNRKYGYTPGFMIEILRNGNMLWRWDYRQANKLSPEYDPYMEEYIQFPKFAEMTKTKEVSAQVPIENVPMVDYTPYCGTWQYVNKDTTFTVSFKEATLKRISPTEIVNKKILVGGYRLTVKGQFDDNYLMTSKIPSVLNFKVPSEPNYEGTSTKQYVYVWAQGFEGDTELEGTVHNQTKGCKYDYLPGFAIKILPNGKLQWYWRKSLANRLSPVELREAEYIQIPGHAEMTKIE